MVVGEGGRGVGEMYCSSEWVWWVLASLLCIQKCCMRLAIVGDAMA